MRSNFLSFTLLFCLLHQIAFAQNMPPGMTKITSVGGIDEYALPNGLRILLMPDPSKPIITVNITYKVGSRHEGYGETGMAHLLEHMVFKGTPKHPNIPQELTEHGARPNGTTSYDRTNYYETFDATEENLRWALDLESDRMINSYVAKKDLDSEFSVVRNEYESGENNPTGVLFKRMNETAFGWHNYGKSTIGERSDIEGAPIENLQAFYHKYYQPDNAVLVVTGKIDPKKTLELIAEYFGKIPKPTRILTPTYTREPTQDGERTVTLRRSGDEQVVACMFHSAPGSHPDQASLSILANILTDEPSGRLYKALVETKKAVGVFGNASGMKEAGYTYFAASLNKEQSVEEVKTALLKVLDDLRNEPITQEEVDRAKARQMKSWEMFMKNTERVGLSLSNYIGMGDWRLAFMYRDQLEKVTPESVLLAAVKYFKSSNRTMGYFIPDKNPDRSEIPVAPDMDFLFKDYKTTVSFAAGEDFDFDPLAIEKKVVRSSLPNGMKYALLQKQNRGNTVTANITLRFGSLEQLAGKSTIGEFTASMLDKGTADFTRQQLKEAFDQLKARVNFFGSASSLSVSIETDKENLPKVLLLVGKILRQPTFPADEFEKMKTEMLANIESQKSEPNAIAGNLYARISSPEYAKSDPRYTKTFEEEAEATKATTLDQVKEFYKNFYGASNATAAIVGDFDKTALEMVMQEVFSNWKSPQPYTRIAREYKTVAPQSQSLQTPDKANAVFNAGYGFAMRSDNPDYPAITLGGVILGGGFLNSRLATRIRQKEGISYTVRGGFLASDLDENASFNAFAIYNPENAARLETAFKEEIDKASAEGFTQEELEAAKSGWLKSRKVNRTSDGALAGALNNYLFTGRDFKWDADLETKVQGLTLDTVNKAMKKYLDYSKMISVKAGDFNKKPAKP